MRLLKVSLTLLVVFTLTTVVFSQSATSSLRGTVSDPNGAVIPGAKVTLSNPATGFSRQATSDGQGFYQFLQLPPGTYDVSADAGKTGKITEKAVQLQVSQPATLNLAVKLGSESTTIEVIGSAPPVNTTDATIGNAFSSQQILALPFDSRNSVEVLSLQPGVSYTGQTGVGGNSLDPAFDSRNGSVAGARQDQTNVTVDGLDNNDQDQGKGFSGALRTPLESVQEFRVTTSSSNADQGRSSGGQVALVTKSGTNNFHGSAYWDNRSSIGEANDWFNKHTQLKSGEPNQPTKLVRNVYGVTLGGPIVKDRLFFFTNWEALRSRETKSVQRLVPSSNLRNGLISYQCSDDPACPAGGVQTLTAANLATMDPVVGVGPSPVSEAIFQSYPQPNCGSVGDGLNVSGFCFFSPIPSDLNTYIAKLDYNLSKDGNHKIFIRGNLMDDAVGGEEEFPGQGPSFVTSNTSKGLAGGYTAVLSNSLINNFRYGFIRQAIGHNGVGTTHRVRMRGFDPPTSFERSKIVAVPLHNFNDDLVWTKGKHSFQFGGNWRFLNNIRASTEASFSEGVTSPTWLDNAAVANTGSSFDPGAFGFPAVNDAFSSDYDFPIMALAGIIPQVDSQYNFTTKGSVLPEGTPVPRHFRSNELEFYAQDAWRVKDNLTLTFGLRYSLLQPPYEIHGQQVAPTISLHDWYTQRGAAMLQGDSVSPDISFDVAGQGNGKKPIWDWDYKNFAPRFAFAYSPKIWQKVFGGSGKSSIRGGWGIYYDHFGQSVVSTFDRTGSFGLSSELTNSAGVQSVDTAPRITGLNDIPASLITPAPAATFPSTFPDIFSITWGLDDKLKTPYSHVFDLSVERELPGNFVVQMAYVGRLGRHLLQQNDLAMPLDIVDPSSKMDYFSAATQLAIAAEHGVDINSIGSIPYFENLFGATSAGTGLDSGCAPGSTPGTNYSATQNIYDLYSCFLHNETTALFILDGAYGGPCFPGCAQLPNGPAGGKQFQFFSPQYSSLYAWQTIGNSSYHSGQFMIRKRMSHGVQFDFNYTYSKSLDVGSDAERIDFVGGPQDQIINAWNPKLERGPSSFDTTHQINTNWVVQLPFGRGRHYAGGVNRGMDAIVGGWDVSGLMRWTSGYPFAIANGANWATNWELGGLSFLTGKAPSTGVFIDACGDPNIFRQPGACNGGTSLIGNDPFLANWRFAHPGEAGQRNNLRGQGYFGIDMGLSKTFKITEGQALHFSWEVFNITNSARFDALSVQSSIDSQGTFGKYSETYTLSRRMQFGLRYSF